MILSANCDREIESQPRGSYDVYAGRWWETADREHGGTIAGTITRAE
jgi:hypothetical protein